MKIRITLVVLCLLVSFGCRKTSAPRSTAPASNVATPAPELSQSQGGTTPAPQARYFKGSIGTSLDLQMKLVRTGDQLSGNYF
jgi:hypothetical protein